MKSIIKDLSFLLRKFSLPTALNVAGLAVAFAVFMSIMGQVYHRHTYNSSVPDAGNVYLLHYNVDGEDDIMTSGADFARMLSSSPKIKAASLSEVSLRDGVMYVNGRYVDFTSRQVDLEFLKLMGTQMVMGRIDDFLKPGCVFVPESFAKKHFGRIDIVGERIFKHGDTFVGGVYKDFDKNCMAGNIVYRYFNKEEFYGDSQNFNFFSLVKVDDPSALEGILSDLDKSAAESAAMGRGTWAKKTYGLTPVDELVYAQNKAFSILAPQVNRSEETLLIAIALIVLLITSINLVNFFIALVPIRLRSINTRKAFGASVAQLRRMLVAETALLSIAAFLIAVGLLALLERTDLGSDAGLESYVPVALATGLLSAAIGAAIGLWPARRLTSISPAIALKGNFGLTPKGILFRNFLIGVQFSAAFAMIIVSVFIYRQRSFLTDSDYGFDKEALITFDCKMGVADNIGAIMADLKAMPEVENVATSASLLGKNVTMGWGRTVNGTNVNVEVLCVSPAFLPTVGVSVVDGRDFAPTDSAAYIFNETAMRAYPDAIKVGNSFGDGTIVGICWDMNYSSKYSAIEPMVLYLASDKSHPWYVNFGYARIKKGTDKFRAMDKVEKLLRRYEPEYPINVSFYDSRFDDIYRHERLLAVRISLYSLLSVAVSIAGVFGLVMFDCQYRRREIAVRKVFGSTSSGIIRRFGFHYLRILALSYAPAALAAWNFSSRWLEKFPYRTHMDWRVFAAVLLFLLVMVEATVIFQSWRAARANPSDNLKYE